MQVRILLGFLASYLAFQMTATAVLMGLYPVACIFGLIWCGSYFVNRHVKSLGESIADPPQS